MAAKRKPEEQEPGAPGWMVTFADMMSLLLTFFILLLSFSTMEEKKVKEALSSLRGALGVLPKSTEISKPDISPPQIRKPPRTEQTEKQIGKLQEQLRSKGMEKKVELSDQGKGILNIRVPASLLFRSGSAQLLESSYGILENISELMAHYLRSYDADFRIEGHTDDVPIGPSDYPSNWELSAARSVSVMRFMTDRMGLPMDHFGVTGYAEFKPLYRPPSLDMNRSRNRRVEIIVIPKKNIEPKPEDPSIGPRPGEHQLLPWDDLPEPM